MHVVFSEVCPGKCVGVTKDIQSILGLAKLKSRDTGAEAFELSGCMDD